MKKPKITTNFVCQECGYDTTSWLGKCPECGAWNSLKEIRLVTNKEQSHFAKASRDEFAKPQKLSDIAYSENSRIDTGFSEMNTVLGGGIVRGSATLIAGDPGVGKSTLLLQLALGLASGSVVPRLDQLSSASIRKTTQNVTQNHAEIRPGLKVLYVSGEESSEQVKMRAERISSEHSESSADQEVRKSDLSDNQKHRKTESSDLPAGKAGFSEKNKSGENLLLLAQTDTDEIVSQIETSKPDLVIIDSIQTIESQNVSGLAGSVGQVRYSALQFVRVAKQNNVPILLVGHVTKEGMVAGPMVLSHMVDTVLFLEGEKFSATRILRSLKNRFGPVDEVGIFLMEESGMKESLNPEQLFLTDPSTSSGPNSSPGSVLVVTLEGSRAFLVELQALAVSSSLPMPRRVVSGIDPRRVELLLAVLQKHVRLPVERMDIFVNVAGGLKLNDPGADLGICLAVYSSLKNIVLKNTVGIAEVGLLGELRNVAGSDKRSKEAIKMGYKKVITAKTHKTLSDVIASLSKS